MQLFDAIENCFPAMEKQYQEICPPPEEFWPPVLVERGLQDAMVGWTQLHLLTEMFDYCYHHIKHRGKLLAQAKGTIVDEHFHEG